VSGDDPQSVSQATDPNDEWVGGLMLSQEDIDQAVAPLEARIAGQAAEIAALKAQLAKGAQRHKLTRPVPPTLRGDPLKATMQRLQVWYARDSLWQHEPPVGLGPGAQDRETSKWLVEHGYYDPESPPSIESLEKVRQELTKADQERPLPAVPPAPSGR
jgi:hypothetical protein